MKNNFLLISINSKFVHSNLAVRYIKEYCKANYIKTEIKEFSINDSFDRILKEIFLSECDIFAFSCYIWNIELVLKICKSLKIIKPHCKILLGGPEVSFNIEELMLLNPSIDYTIFGEGEKTFLELALFLQVKGYTNIKNICGIAYRKNNQIKINEPRKLIDNLDDIPFPYTDLADLNNKIVYYETNRGCPFSCQYCLSSTFAGVRYFSFERIKKDLDFFIDNKVTQVKLVDRTFNCNNKLCLNIMKYIIDKKSLTNFHFEIAADLITNEFIKILEKAPKGMFQFEIGVQSTNNITLNEIQRKTNIYKVEEITKTLVKIDNAHIHLDLIAGLPFEDYNSFALSFNTVYNLNPNMLQLGFLKLLKGTGLRKHSKQYNIKYNEHAPYEVLSTEWLSYNDILKLKSIEHIVDTYYNSSRFTKTLEYILLNIENDCNNKPNVFQFFDSFSTYCELKSFFDSPKSIKDLYIILFEFANLNNYDKLILNGLMKYDWLLSGGSSNMPLEFKRYNHIISKEKIHNFIKNSSDFHQKLKKFPEVNQKNILKKVSYEIFNMNIIGDYKDTKKTIVFFVTANSNVNSFTYNLEDIIFFS